MLSEHGLRTGSDTAGNAKGEAHPGTPSLSPWGEGVEGLQNSCCVREGAPAPRFSSACLLTSAWRWPGRALGCPSPTQHLPQRQQARGTGEGPCTSCTSLARPACAWMYVHVCAWMYVPAHLRRRRQGWQGAGCQEVCAGTCECTLALAKPRSALSLPPPLTSRPRGSRPIALARPGCGSGAAGDPQPVGRRVAAPPAAGTHGARWGCGTACSSPGGTHSTPSYLAVRQAGSDRVLF